MNENDSLSKERLLQEIADLKKRKPAHSVKPEYVRKLEELEDKLEELEQQDLNSAP